MENNFLVFCFSLDSVISSPECKLFLKLSKAIQYASVDQNRKVFASEISKGYRKYIVIDLESFWRAYQNSEKKNYYEVILSDNAVKMFLDLEFMIKLNEGKDGKAMTREIISAFDDAVNVAFERKNSSKSVVVLESSSQTKFSIHLIFSSVVFANIQECGKFVRNTLSSLSEEHKAMFLVKTESNDITLFVDQTVYNNNRNLRIMQSSKYGEIRPLICSSFKDDASFRTNVSEKEVFMESLVTNITCKEEDYLFYKKGQKERAPRFPVPKNQDDSEFRNFSPVPNIDKFVRDIVKPGRVRKITYNDKKETVRYDVVGQPYCRTKGGNHRSSNIYFKYFFSSNTLIQDCFSDHCKNKLIHKIPLP